MNYLIINFVLKLIIVIKLKKEQYLMINIRLVILMEIIKSVKI
jgi:hypothetical protein